MNGQDLLTVSRLKSFQACPRKHYYAYEIGMRADAEAKALRFGRIYHVALDMWAQSKDINDGFDAIYRNYDIQPEWADPFWWAVERETCLRLFAGYVWRWQDDCIEVMESEQVFRLPILNPETGRPTQVFERGGKIDKIIRLPDTRVGVMEHKTTSDSVASDSDYWNILRLDPQVSMYFDAKPDAVFILYDVTRKPCIAPKQIAKVDDFGQKIVLDKNGDRVIKKGGLPRETGDSSLGYVLQTRIESPDEFSQRLADDIQSRPDFYYARREIPRLDDDIIEFRRDLWNEQQAIRDRQKRGSWPRRPGQHCDYCAFKHPCFNNAYPIGETLPSGFIKMETVHPELELEIANGNENRTTTTDATECAAATE